MRMASTVLIDGDERKGLEFRNGRQLWAADEELLRREGHKTHMPISVGSGNHASKTFVLVFGSSIFFSGRVVLR